MRSLVLALTRGEMQPGGEGQCKASKTCRFRALTFQSVQLWANPECYHLPRDIHPSSQPGDDEGSTGSIGGLDLHYYSGLCPRSSGHE